MYGISSSIIVVFVKITIGVKRVSCENLRRVTESFAYCLNV